MTHLVVFSPSRWGLSHQRPQQLLTRLSRRFPVLFVEPPTRDADGEARLEVCAQTLGVEVLCPCTPLDSTGFADDQLALIGPLVAAHLESRGIVDYAVWLDTPLALPVLDALAPRAVFCDCSDGLPAPGMARALRERHATGLERADLVFTGGPALCEALQALHPRVHCLPSAVDAAHFALAAADAAGDDALIASRLHQGIAGPRIGFNGVIDGRLDLALLAGLAQARPDWQFVMVGPVVGIDPARLPRRRNLHWLGQQPHGLLPHLMAHWDVAMLPFAADEATRFVSPTQALEALAAGMPVVSTPLGDVVTQYGGLVRVAADAAGFVAQCEQAMAETPAQRARRIAQSLAAVRGQSWDETARRIEQLIVERLGEDERPAPSASAPRHVEIELALLPPRALPAGLLGAAPAA